MNLGLQVLVLLAVSENVLVEAVKSNTKTGHFMDIVKRHLRWNANKDIVSSITASSNLRIDYLQPHSGSMAVSDTSSVYMAFTLYRRNGDWIVPNTGMFHFIDLAKAQAMSSKCRPSTNHAGAYYHFYGKCPSADTDLVASGWCYRGSRGLVYNSYTFNSVGFSYMDGQYYLNDDRTVNPYEITLLSHCYNSWKDSGFLVNSWKCPTKDIPLSAGLTGGFGVGRSKRSTYECSNCDCLTAKGSLSVKGAVREHLIWFCVLMVLLFPQI